MAALARELGVEKESYGEARTDRLAAYEKIAIDFYCESPNEPAVFDLFLGVARNAEPVKARSVANQIPSCPRRRPPRTRPARLLPASICRARLRNGTTTRAGFTDWQDYKGKILVFYFWATWASSPEGESKIKTGVPPGAILVSANLDQDSAKGKAARSKSQMGGIAHYDPRGLNAPLATQLRANKVPGVHVIGRRGLYVGGGGPESLTALIEAAGQQ